MELLKSKLVEAENYILDLEKIKSELETSKGAHKETEVSQPEGNFNHFEEIEALQAENHRIKQKLIY